MRISLGSKYENQSFSLISARGKVWIGAAGELSSPEHMAAEKECSDVAVYIVQESHAQPDYHWRS